MIERAVLATRNPGKLGEFKTLFSGFIFELISLKGLQNPPNIIEDGDTYKANALKKARGICAFTKDLTIADDSGLEVEVLKGKPGVNSARYAGEYADDTDNIKKLLNEMQGKRDRRARFICCLALVKPGGEEIVVEGICGGEILEKPRGNGGFGYDPVFLINELDKTMAELTIDEKNSLSHRAKAVNTLLEVIKNKNM